MKIAIKYIGTILIYLLSCSQQGFAQEYSEIEFDSINVVDTLPRIEVIGHYSNGKLKLRWAPNKSKDWYALATQGYKIERFVMDESSGLPNMISRDTQLIFPWNLTRFKELNIDDKANKYILTMGECIYGDRPEGNMSNFAGTAKELDNKYGFALFAADMDFQAAEAGGLGYEDEVDPGIEYFYRISALQQKSIIHPAFLTIKAMEKEIPKPRISAGIEGEKKVTIQWLRIEHEDFFSAYYIEESLDGKTYNRVQELPFVGGASREYPSSVFSYTLQIENYQPAYYRIVGIDPFGMLSMPSKEVRLMARDRTPCDEPYDMKVLTDDKTGQVLIDWKSSSCEDVDGFEIWRSSDFDGTYLKRNETLVSKNQFDYREKVNNTRKKYYYKVASVDTAGNRAFTIPKLAAFRDTIPPCIPTNLKGEVDSSGIVTITWNDCTEKDLRGYHIYRANASYHMYTLINPQPISINSFRDTITLKTTTEDIFYKVTSVDFQGHISSFSEALKLTKPDTIPPFPPSIEKYNQDLSSISIYWSPSRSKDVEEHRIYRKEDNEKWEFLGKISETKRPYVDQNINAGHRYSYKILAIDDAKLSSVDHAQVSIKFVDKNLPEIVEIDSCFYTKNEHIRIKWNQPIHEKTKGIIVYRSINNGPLSVVGRVNNGNSFEDRKKKGANYSYAIKHVWANGKKSKFSEEVIPQKL